MAKSALEPVRHRRATPNNLSAEESCVVACLHVDSRRRSGRCRRRICSAAEGGFTPLVGQFLCSGQVGQVRQGLGRARDPGVADQRRDVPRAGTARRGRFLARRDRRQGGHARSSRRSAASRKRNGVEPRQTRRATREALLKHGRTSTVNVKLGPDDVRSTYIYPLPKDPEKQYKAAVPRLSQHAREGRRALSHDARDGGRAQRPGQAHRTWPDAAPAQRGAGVARLFGQLPGTRRG